MESQQPTQQQYEFTEAENKFFKKAARSMSLAGACKLFLGLVICIFFSYTAYDTWQVQKDMKLDAKVTTVAPDTKAAVELNKTMEEFQKRAGNLFAWLDRLVYFQIFIAVAGLAFAIIGSGCLRTSKAFTKITTTQGNDIGLLMQALQSIGKLYWIKCLFLVPATIIAILLLAIVIINQWANVPH